MLLSCLLLHSCSSEQEVNPSTESQVKELLAKYEINDYSLGSYDTDSLELKNYNILELEVFLKKLSKHKGTKNTDCVRISKGNSPKASLLKSMTYPPDRAIIEVHGSSYFFPSDIVHFMAAIQYHSHNYGMYLWYPDGLHIYCTGIMPCSLSEITYKHVYSFDDKVVMETWFVLSWGIDIEGLPLVVSERMSALLIIDMVTETMQTDLRYFE